MTKTTDRVEADSPAWLLALAIEFTPKVIPLDVTSEGTYEEATTRWGMNPVYEALPLALRVEAEGYLSTNARHQFARLRGWTT